jgi:hypothetical protein
MTAYPADEWCTCEPKVDVAGAEYPPMGAKADA